MLVQVASPRCGRIRAALRHRPHQAARQRPPARRHAHPARDRCAHHRLLVAGVRRGTRAAARRLPRSRSRGVRPPAGLLRHLRRRRGGRLGHGLEGRVGAARDPARGRGRAAASPRSVPGAQFPHPCVPRRREHAQGVPCDPGGDRSAAPVARKDIDDRRPFHHRRRAGTRRLRRGSAPVGCRAHRVARPRRRDADRARQDVARRAAAARRTLGVPGAPAADRVVRASDRVRRRRADRGSRDGAADPARHAPRGAHRRKRPHRPAHRSGVRLRRGPGRARAPLRDPARPARERRLLRELLRPQRQLQSARDRPRARPARPGGDPLLERRRPVRSRPRRGDPGRRREPGVVARPRLGTAPGGERLAAPEVLPARRASGPPDVARHSAEASRAAPARASTPAGWPRW